MIDQSYGRVQSFDQEVGLGMVEATDGRTFAFHCTAISDGTRQIGEGQPVVFTVGAAGPGRWEAVRVIPVAAVPPAAP